jgi:membrane protein required for colicin V production
MAIDVIALFLLVLAVYKGWTRGLVMAVFTFVSYIVALAIAFKFSGWVATHYFKSLTDEGRWPSILAFLLVMVAVMIAVRVIGKIIEKSLEFMLMGIFNKLAGILFFSSIYCSVFAVILVYACRFELVGKELIGGSFSGYLLLNWGTGVIAFFSEWIPELSTLFKDAANYIKQ